jgi:hypothetical protein
MNQPITITDQMMLDALKMAYFKLAISGAQSYTIEGREYTRFDLDKIQSAIVDYEIRVASATTPGFGAGTILVGF